MDRKADCYFNCLMYLLAQVIDLGVIGGIIEQFNLQLIEKCSPKVIWEFWVTIDY